MTASVDVAVVGSGPSGALAACRLVRAGFRVVMLDVGHDDDIYRARIPDLPFSELRRTDPGQRSYFLGDALEGIPTDDVRVGAQLTPPRQFVTRDTEAHLPCLPDAFQPMQSLALGGLGAAWGAASFTYSETELQRMGIPARGFQRYYNEVARDVGISGDPADDASRHCFAAVTEHLPPLALDSGARAVWQAYSGKRRERLLAAGFSLGRTPLAVLSCPVAGRDANPYFDMDFWSESRRSVFRPRYLLEALQSEPGFFLERGHLVHGFKQQRDGVEISSTHLPTRRAAIFQARRLVLCAGAINSARLALNALQLPEQPVPLLCNPYVYLPCINRRMLGRAADDRRHSLSQLVGIYEPPGSPADVVSLQLYSYRSLLLFKLVKEIPLPPWAGLLSVRLLVNSLSIVGLHHADVPDARRNLRTVSVENGRLPALRFEYARSPAEEKTEVRAERGAARMLRRLGVFPCARLAPGPASSIHYAGTIPVRPQGDGWGSHPDGHLLLAPHVYVGDSSSWRYLPAKGLTFTLMANALRVADQVIADLRGNA